MSKIPKAKCEKCKHCKMIKWDGEIVCYYAKAKFTDFKPKRCSNFLKIGGEQNAQ